MSPSRHNEIIDVDTPEGKKRFKIIEMPVDPPLTVRRTLVPVDTTEEDIPVGARLLSEKETEGHLARSSSVEKFLVGELVRKKIEAGDMSSDVTGTIDAILKGGRFRIRWSDGSVGRHEAKELTHVW